MLFFFCQKLSPLLFPTTLFLFLTHCLPLLDSRCKRGQCQLCCQERVGAVRVVCLARWVALSTESHYQSTGIGQGEDGEDYSKSRDILDKDAGQNLKVDSDYSAEEWEQQKEKLDKLNVEKTKKVGAKSIRSSGASCMGGTKKVE